MRAVFVVMVLTVSGCGSAIEDAIEEGRREAEAEAVAAEKEATRRDNKEDECITSARQLVGENLGARQIEFPGRESVTLQDDGSWVVDGVVTLVDNLVRQDLAFIVSSNAAGKTSVEVAEPVSNASPNANDLQESAIKSIRESGGTVSSRGHEVRMPNATDDDLAPLRQLPRLTHLYLDDSKITDAGLVYLSQASRLSTLSLENTAVTDDGLKHLRGLPLTILDLRGTSVSDGSVTHLATLKNMFVLQIDDSAISEQGMKELEDALPRCRVMTGTQFIPAGPSARHLRLVPCTARRSDAGRVESSKPGNCGCETSAGHPKTEKRLHRERPQSFAEKRNRLVSSLP